VVIGYYFGGMDLKCISCWNDYLLLQSLSVITFLGKSSESVQCALTGPCLRMRHRPSA